MSYKEAKARRQNKIKSKQYVLQGWGRLHGDDYDYDYDYFVKITNDYDYDYTPFFLFDYDYDYDYFYLITIINHDYIL